MEVCRATVQAQGLLTARARAYVLLEFDIRVDRILDLTRPETLKTLDLAAGQLLRSSEEPSAYEVPHAVAFAAYTSGRVAGILAQDATQTGSTLALYPARLLSKDMIRLKQTIPF
jgi:hypothetical protein